MEGVVHKVDWNVHRRAAKHIPHYQHHPAWRIGREASVVIDEIIAPIEAQLEEDATWKE